MLSDHPTPSVAPPRRGNCRGISRRSPLSSELMFCALNWNTKCFETVYPVVAAFSRGRLLRSTAGGSKGFQLSTSAWIPQTSGAAQVEARQSTSFPPSHFTRPALLFKPAPSGSRQRHNASHRQDLLAGIAVRCPFFRLPFCSTLWVRVS